MQRGKVDGVVGTLMTNFGFEREMQRLGVGFERANVGDRYVLEQMQARGWLYGGESGTGQQQGAQAGGEKTANRDGVHGAALRRAHPSILVERS